MAFVCAYIQCLDGPVNWFSLTFCILIQVFLLLTVTLRGVSNKHCLLSLFSLNFSSLMPIIGVCFDAIFTSVKIAE